MTSDMVRRMQSLKDVIVALRGEIEAALVREPLPENARWEADRVVATVQFVVSGNGTAQPEFLVPISGDERHSPNANTLTIEFRSSRQQAELSTKEIVPQHDPARTEMLSDTDRNEVIAKLSEVFGTPSFDSSARATVFREALENLDDETTTAVTALLNGDSADVSAEAKRAVAMLDRVLKSGPAGTTTGRKILATLFRRFHPSAIVALVKTVWKEQQDWMA